MPRRSPFNSNPEFTVSTHPLLLQEAWRTPQTRESTETHELALEVVVLWGDQSVLHVDHLYPLRDYYVGEPTACRSVDFVINSAVLGASSVALCEYRTQEPVALIPDSSDGSITIDGRTVSLTFARQMGILHPSTSQAQVSEFSLGLGRGARFVIGDFTFIVRGVHVGKIVAGPRRTDKKPLAYVSASAAMTLAFLLTVFLSPPSPRGLASAFDDDNSRLVQYLTRANSLELNPAQQGGATLESPADPASIDLPGEAGNPNAIKSNGRISVKGPRENPEPTLLKSSADSLVQDSGVLPAMRGMQALMSTPSSPYGADQALGKDPQSIIAAIVGNEFVPDAGKLGGDMVGPGQGSRNRPDGTVWTDPHFNMIGDPKNPPCAFNCGSNPRHPRAERVPGSIIVRTVDAEVIGGLSKEVIQRVVRQHHNEVKFCYEQELHARPDLQGRVKIAFVISPTGSVQSAMVAQSALGHSGVGQCIVQAVRRWVFPTPEGGGVVAVNYPFVLSTALASDFSE